VSAENVEIVRAGLEAFAEGGVDALVEMLPPEFEFTTPPELASEPGTYRGHDGVRRYFDEFYEAMDEIRVEPQQFHDLGDKVAVEFTLHASGRTTGIETTIDAVQLWDVTGGIARSALICKTLEEARAAA
jgi:ketosteroid isomerase-like protein